MKIRIEDGDTVIEYEDVKAYGMVIRKKEQTHSLFSANGKLFDACTVIAGMQILADHAVGESKEITKHMVRKVKREMKKVRVEEFRDE